MTINLTREGMLEELRNGNAVIRLEYMVEAYELQDLAELKYSLMNPIFYDGMNPFLYNGKNGLGFYDEMTIDPLYNISFNEFIELPSYREPIIELSKEIVGTQDKFMEDLKNGEAELEVFGMAHKILIMEMLNINLRTVGPYLYVDKERQKLALHKEPSDKPIVLDMKRYLELA